MLSKLLLCSVATFCISVGCGAFCGELSAATTQADVDELRLYLNSDLQAQIDAAHCTTHAEVQAITAQHMRDHFSEYCALLSGEDELAQQMAEEQQARMDAISSDSGYSSYVDGLEARAANAPSESARNEANAALGVSETIRTLEAGSDE